MQPDYYELLGVTRQASQEEIRSAYRRVAAEAHPDRGGTNGLFRLVRHAYETLADQASRSEYDRRTYGAGDTSGSVPPDGRRASEPSTTHTPSGDTFARCPRCGTVQNVALSSSDIPCSCGARLRVPTAAAGQGTPAPRSAQPPTNRPSASATGHRYWLGHAFWLVLVCTIAAAIWWMTLASDMPATGKGSLSDYHPQVVPLAIGIITGIVACVILGANAIHRGDSGAAKTDPRFTRARTDRSPTCPCGCGRQIKGITVKGGAAVAERALAARRDAESALTIYESNPAAARLMEDAGITHQRLCDLVSSAIQIRAEGLMHAHRQARPGVTPDLNQLRRALESLEALSTAARAFVDAIW